ncbi:MAG: chlorophyllase [Micromonosporaceae bacterium]|nr:chlorophyllase [Micromonosporaceae bacterium]
MSGRSWERVVGAALALASLVLTASCAPVAGTPVSATTTAAPSGEPVPTITDAAPAPTIAVTGTAPAATALPPIEAGPAPAERFTVQRREITVTRDGRSLRTVIYYPTTSGDGRGETPASGFPLVLFSHGLRGSPEDYEPSLRDVAAAGFVIAAPAYPYTSEDAKEYNPVDLVNQPADASAVITAVLTLNTTAGDPLAGRLDPNRIAAMGHSAGGYTTMGLLAGFRDPRLRAAVVLAGASLGGSYADPAVPVLFVHGDADSVVPYTHGRAAYDYLPWPKAFLTVIGGGHTDFLDRDSRAAAAVTATVVDFLRAMLYGDIVALARIPGEATVDTVTRFESALDSAGRPPEAR